MFALRVLFCSTAQTMKYFSNRQPNARLFSSSVIDAKPHFIYPNNDEKLGKYLDHLDTQTDERNLFEIRRRYAVRKSIVQYIMELESEMKNENNEEILNLALDEKRVS